MTAFYPLLLWMLLFPLYQIGQKESAKGFDIAYGLGSLLWLFLGLYTFHNK